MIYNDIGMIIILMICIRIRSGEVESNGIDLGRVWHLKMPKIAELAYHTPDCYCLTPSLTPGSLFGQ